jgi:hypothetical protein
MPHTSNMEHEYGTEEQQLQEGTTHVKGNFPSRRKQEEELH